MDTPHPSSFSDVTLDAPVSTDGSRAQDAHRAVALVEGSTPHMSAETQDLLRSRLRASALLLFAGYLAFLIKSLIYLSDFKTTVYHDDTYIIDIENKIKKQLENLRESTVSVP